MIQPLHDRVLIKPIVNPTETDSGLHLVEHAKPETHGTVVATSSHVGIECCECGQRQWRPAAVKPGDHVIFSWDVGQEILMNDERFLLMREEDITAVLEGVN